jgi:hypothetical protein
MTLSGRIVSNKKRLSEFHKHLLEQTFPATSAWERPQTDANANVVEGSKATQHWAPGKHLRMAVWKSLKHEGLYPFHVELIQNSKPMD